MVIMSERQPSFKLPRWLPTTKKRAFVSHLALSIVVFLLLAGVIYFYWFPGGLFAAAGGWEGIRIVAGVDLVLGPLLMLIVYNVKKRPILIVMDVIIVLAVQFSCLGAGVYIVHQERPAAIVFIGGDPLVKKYKEIEAYEKSKEIVESLDPNNPTYFYLDIPKSEVDDLLLLISRQVDFLATKTHYYKPLPREPEKLQKILGKELSSCTKVEIKSAYSSGKICFNPSDFSFSDFQQTLEKPSETKPN